jgi:hypothetical protein
MNEGQPTAGMGRTSPRRVLIEGYSIEEILAFPNEQLDQFVFCGEPIVFRVGSAEILGRFERDADRIILELAHIDGGGEGALPTLGALASRYALREGLEFLEWRVHAVRCASPNPKLRRVLERRGFKVTEVAGAGECYHLVERCVAFDTAHRLNEAQRKRR